MKRLFLGIFFLPLVWLPFAGNETYETAKMAWFLGFLAAAAAGAGVFFARSKKFSLTVPNAPILGIIIAWLLSFALSTIFSRAPVESFWGSYTRLQGFFVHALYAAHFFACWWIFQKESLRRDFVKVLLTCGALASLIALSQKFSQEPSELFALAEMSGRVYKPVGSPVGLGQFLIFPWIAAFFGAVEKFVVLAKAETYRFPVGAGNDKRRCDSQSKNRRGLAGYVLLLGLFSVALFFTMNRASMLGLAAAVLLFAFLSVKNPRVKKAMMASGGLLLVVFATLFAVRFGEVLRLHDDSRLRSLGSRAVLWEAALKVFPRHPWLGTGPETAYQTLQETVSPRLYHYERLLDIPDRVHNIVLETLVTRGLLGVAALLALVVAVCAAAIRFHLKTLSSRLAFFSLVAFFVALQFGFAFVTHAVYAVAMLALLAADVPKFRARLTLVPPRAPRVLAAIFCLLAALFLGSLSYRWIKTEWLLHRAVALFFVEDSRAPQMFVAAESLLPFFREIPYMRFSLYQDQANKNPAAWMDFMESAERTVAAVSGESFYAHLMRARLAGMQGSAPLAEAEFAAAAAKAPNWPGVWYQWGAYEYEAGRRAAAHPKWQKFLEFAPPFAEEDSQRGRIFRISNPLYEELKDL